MMNKGIVICTWPGGKEPLGLLLESLDGVTYPIYLVVNGGRNLDAVDWVYFEHLAWNHTVFPQDDLFELGAIKKILDKTMCDEFVFLQDTIEIKNQDIFDIMFKDYEGRSVAYNPYFQMYLGKFRRTILAQMSFPETLTKADSIRQEELFTTLYRQLDPDTVVFNPDFVDDKFHHLPKQFIFGRENLVMEDAYLIKRKGTWSAEQI